MDEGFLYSPAPNPRGGFTTRAILGRQITETELEAAVAAETGQPPEVCAQVFTSYLRQMMAAAGKSRWSAGLYDLIGLYPTAGGSKDAPDAFHTAADMNAGLRLAFLASAVAAWQEGLQVQSQGFAGLVTPVLTSVLCCSTDQADCYVPGHLIHIRGQHLKMDYHDPELGAFFRMEGGQEVRAATYGGNTRLRLIAMVPGGLSGPLELRVASHINGSVRSTVYPAPLQQVPSPFPAP
ncbi:MAG: hypothetical protein JNG86_20720 [Verrucomicrobiaceae bacterium]|nr:hypothetical protein [Verrucomicrobiaceae bacterium]